MTRTFWLLTVMMLISLTIFSCQESSDNDLITETIKLDPINAIAKGTIGDFYGSRIFHVAECDKKWWADSLDHIFLQGDGFEKFDVGQTITVQLSEYVPYPVRTEGDSLFYYVRISDILKSRTTQEMKQDCAEFEPLEVPAIIESRSSFSSLTPLVVNVYVHFMKDINGESTSGSSLATAQRIVVDLNKAFSGTKISFWLKGYDILSLNYSTFSNNDKNELVNLFNQDNHSDCIDMYMLSRIPDRDNKDGKQTVGGTIATSYPTSLSVRHLNGTDYAHEMGHLFNLYHTHHGTYRGDEASKEGIPEYADGSNSSIAGDYVTDTPADPNCWDNLGNYNGGNLKDSKGKVYSPDPTNIMSYSIQKKQFTEKQAERMHARILGSLRSVLPAPKVTGSTHFNKSATFSVENPNPDLVPIIVVKRYTPSAVADDVEPTCSEERYTDASFTLTSSKTEYFEIFGRYSSFTSYETCLKVTSGAPSPYTGTLWWKYNGSEGFTTNMQHGEPLVIRQDGNTMTLDYLDKAGAKLSNLNYMIVTAANRVLRGSTMQITRADCSLGYLKVRMSDACGTSESLFTIPVSVSGAYYGINMKDGTVIFESKIGNVASSNAKKTQANKRSIKSIIVYTSLGEQVANLEGTSGTEATLNISGWPKGEYKAVISDGEGYTQEIPFVV